jgi:hypothetical protein
MVGDSSNGNARGSAASDVLLKIAQCELSPTEKTVVGYRISAFDKRAILPQISSEGLF